MIESLPLAVTHVTTMLGQKTLTNATGFFFERDGNLFVVTSRHVVLDEPSNHHPDRIEIELHVNPVNLGETVQFSIPLYRDGKSVWREGLDSAGAIDVVALQLEREALPKALLMRAFTPAHLVGKLEQVEMGGSVLIVGFPLGVHDTLHRLQALAHALGALGGEALQQRLPVRARLERRGEHLVVALRGQRIVGEQLLGHRSAAILPPPAASTS